jgi:heme iron utilization protein
VTTTAQPNHDAPAEALRVAEPLAPVETAQRRTPAEEARTIVAAGSLATLSTLTRDGGPWGSLVAYATIGEGRPVLLVSTLAEHGRNLHRDPRASLCVAADPAGRDPLDSGRVTLAGVARRPEGDDAARARDAYLAALPASREYAAFGDFSLWVLEIERARWVGGFGRMDSVTAEAYATATPDPTARAAAGAVRHLNDDHADVLLLMAQRLGGHPDATSARARGIDRHGLDLWTATPRGPAPVRLGFTGPVQRPDGLREACVELARRARSG